MPLDPEHADAADHYRVDLRSAKALRTPRRGRRSFAACHRWIDEALCHRSDGFRLFNSPLSRPAGRAMSGPPALSPQCLCDVHAARALLQQATEKASENLAPQ